MYAQLSGAKASPPVTSNIVSAAPTSATRRARFVGSENHSAVSPYASSTSHDSANSSASPRPNPRSASTSMEIAALSSKSSAGTAASHPDGDAGGVFAVHRFGSHSARKSRPRRADVERTRDRHSGQ